MEGEEIPGKADDEEVDWAAADPGAVADPMAAGAAAEGSCAAPAAAAAGSLIDAGGAGGAFPVLSAVADTVLALAICVTEAVVVAASGATPDAAEAELVAL